MLMVMIRRGCQGPKSQTKLWTTILDTSIYLHLIYYDICSGNTINGRYKCPKFNFILIFSFLLLFNVCSWSLWLLLKKCFSCFFMIHYTKQRLINVRKQKNIYKKKHKPQKLMFLQKITNNNIKTILQLRYKFPKIPKMRLPHRQTL